MAGDVRIEVTQAYGGGEFLAQHAGVSQIYTKLVGLDGHAVRSIDFAEGEVADGTTEGLIVAQTDIAHGVEQGNTRGEFAEPRGVIVGKARPRNGKGVFGGVPILGMHIGVGGRTDIAHTTSTGIGRYGLGHYGRANRIELVAHFIFCAENKE